MRHIPGTSQAEGSVECDTMALLMDTMRAIDDAGLRWLSPHRRDALLAVSNEVERLSISDGVLNAWYDGQPESGRDLAGMVYRLLAVVEPS